MRDRGAPPRFRTLGEAWLAARMVAWAWSLVVLKRFVRLPRLVELVRHRSAAATARRDSPEREQVIRLAGGAARLTERWQAGNCLDRGLLLYRFLGRANARPSLVLGFSVEPSGRLQGHAWVTVDDQPVGESAEQLAHFHTALTFTADGELIAPSDAGNTAAVLWQTS